MCQISVSFAASLAELADGEKLRRPTQSLVQSLTHPAYLMLALRNMYAYICAAERRAVKTVLFFYIYII